ncbi:MAG: sigma-70 family RNA polymerase sigma factor [Labilithrix sp.]|nr:sigma-70 family RNA polymerase sigma factor [Labilithrix sp.]
MGEVEAASKERFHALFSAEFAWIWTTLRRLGVKPADLEDVTHDVLLVVYRKLDTYDASRPLRPWLFAFAYRAASDYRRLARHREEPSEDVPDLEASVAASDEVLEKKQESALVHAALARIHLDRRAVLVAHEIDGTPMKDIAQSLGIPLNTAYSRLRIAREELTAAVLRIRARRPRTEQTRGES